MTKKSENTIRYFLIFSVTADVLNVEFVYQCIPAWDSVGHMRTI